MKMITKEFLRSIPKECTCYEGANGIIMKGKHAPYCMFNAPKVGDKFELPINPLSEVDFVNSMYSNSSNGMDDAKGIDMEALTFDAIVWLILVPTFVIGIVYGLSYLFIKMRG